MYWKEHEQLDTGLEVDVTKIYIYMKISKNNKIV